MEDSLARRFRLDNLWSSSRVLIERLGTLVLNEPSFLFLELTLSNEAKTRMQNAATMIREVFSTSISKSNSSEMKLRFSLWRELAREFDHKLIVSLLSFFFHSFLDLTNIPTSILNIEYRRNQTSTSNHRKLDNRSC